LFKYAKDNGIILKLDHDIPPWSLAIAKNNYEIVQLFREYGKKNYIILDLNRYGTNIRYPFVHAINNNNLELIILLIKYAKENHLILDLNGKLYNNKYSFF